MNSLSQDRTFLEKGVDELEDYLLSDELYWPLSASFGYSLPRLTIGGLLLTLKRCEAWAADQTARSSLVEIKRKLEIGRQRWRVHWEKKVEQEFRARVNLWSNFLADYRSAPDLQADLFRHEVRWRTILDLLESELPDSDEKELLNQLDQNLRIYWSPGEFVWEPQLTSTFPRADYWYLYGHLKG